MVDQIKMIADYYGEASQLGILREECGELIQASSKYDRYGAAARDQLIEELADVELMIDQMKHLLNCRYEVECIKQQKIRRQIERIEMERKP